MDSTISDLGFSGSRESETGERYPLSDRERYFCRAAGINVDILDANQRAMIIAALAFDNELVDGGGDLSNINIFSEEGGLRHIIHHHDEEAEDRKKELKEQEEKEKQMEAQYHLAEQYHHATEGQQSNYHHNLASFLFLNVDRVGQKGGSKSLEESFLKNPFSSGFSDTHPVPVLKKEHNPKAVQEMLDMRAKLRAANTDDAPLASTLHPTNNIPDLVHVKQLVAKSDKDDSHTH